MTKPWEQYDAAPTAPWLQYQEEEPVKVDPSAVEALVGKPKPAPARIADDIQSPDRPSELVRRNQIERSGASGELKAPDRPEATIGNALRGAGISSVESWKQAGAGIREQFQDAFGPSIDAWIEKNMPNAPGLSLEEQRARGGTDAERDYARAGARMDAATPDFDTSTWKGWLASGAYGGVNSLIQTAPGVAVGLAAGGPAGLGIMGLQTGAGAYGKYRERGATPSMALLGAVGEGVTEVATEKLPMGYIVEKFGKTGFRKFLSEYLGKEMLGEQVATFTQDAIDTAIANPDKTWSDFWGERADAAGQTAIATLVQSGAYGGMSQALKYAADADLKRENREFEKARNETSVDAAAREAFDPNARQEGLSVPPKSVRPDAAPAKADVPLSQADIDSPLPNDALQAGKNAAADALGQDRAVKSPATAKRPAVAGFDRMVQITLGTESQNRDLASDGSVLTSTAGAKGRMQVLDGTNMDPGFGVRPAQNDSLEERARVGRDYLSAMMRRYGGDPSKAWAAYNAGPGRLDDAIQAHGADWLDHMPDETQKYVFKNLSQLGSEGFDGEGNVASLGVSDDVETEDTLDFIRRILGEDVMADTPVDEATPGAQVAAPVLPDQQAVESAPPPPALAPPSLDQGGASAAPDIRGEQQDEEWTRFAPDSGTLNIPRSEMPQVEAGNRGALVNFLSGRGITNQEVTVPAASLKPTQGEFSEAKVEKARTREGGDRAILISSDGHILDGHHQWMAKRDAGEDVRAIQLNAPIAELVDQVHDFPSSQIAETPQEVKERSNRAEKLKNNHDLPLLTFLAANGGIADDEGHGLRKMRNLQRPIAGLGSLIRDKGMKIDRARELLEEAGWIPEGSTTADVLDMIERASFGEPMYHPGGAGNSINPKEARSSTEEAAREEIRAIVDGLGFEGWTPQFEQEAVNNYGDGDTAKNAVMRVIDDHMTEDVFSFAEATSTEDYYVPGFDDEEDARRTNPGASPFDDEESGQRPAPVGGSAGQGQDEPAQSGPAEGPVIEDTPSGKGLKISGATPEQVAAIQRALPENVPKPLPGKDGSVTYSKKHEQAIRDALQDDAPEVIGEGDPRLTAHERAALEYAVRSERNGGAGWHKDSSAFLMAKAMLDADQTRSANEEDLLNAAQRLHDKAAEKATKAVAPSLTADDQQPERTMTQRQRGELEARQQQGMARRGGQSAVSDQEGGMFSAERDQGDLLSAPKVTEPVTPKAQSTLGGKADDTYTSADLEGMTPGLSASVERVNGDVAAQETILDAIDRGLIPDGDMLMLGSPRWALEKGFADIGPTDRGRIGRITDSGKKKLAELRAPAPKAKPSGNKIFTDDAAEKARARLKAKLSGTTLNSGVDPELLYDGIVLAGYHIEKGARSFAAMTKAIAEDLGASLTTLKPYLRAWYNGARDMLEDAGESVDGMDGPGAVKAALTMIDDTRAGAPAQQQEGTAAPTAPRAEEGNATRPQNNGTPLESAFVEAFGTGRSFSTITEARAFAAEVTGEKVEPGTAQAKALDEAIESAVVRAARQIVAENKAPYDRLVQLYAQQPKLTVRTSTSVEQQAYSTPVPLAYVASQLAGIDKGSTVYEPSAGNGALLIAATPSKIIANELNPDRVASLRAMLPDATVRENDAAEYAPGIKVDVVIANPPFGPVKDDAGNSIRFQVDDQYSTNEIDHAISMKALEAMKDGGSAVLIVGGPAKTITDPKKRADAYNAKAKREFYFKLYSQYNVTDHFTVNGALYERQGAGWPVDVIVINGRGRSALSLPAVKAPRQVASWDALSEVLNVGRSQTAGSIRQSGAVNSEQGTGQAGTDAGNAGSGGKRGPDRRAGSREDQQPGAVRGGPVSEQSASDGVGERPAGEAAPAGDAGQRSVDRRDLVKVEENERQATYRPGSDGQPMQTLVPVNMGNAITESLENLADRRGSIDGYVADRLGYSAQDLIKNFGAEQIDAIALAIDNIERGAGFIIGDQTGIGKGRVVAAVIRYAMKRELTPIFVTEKPNLYADMYRDLTDIGIQKMLGREPKLVMTNGGKIDLSEDGSKTLKSVSDAKKHSAYLVKLANEGIKSDGVDAIFTTYSQMQTVKGQETDRQRALRTMANGAVVILDESHNAGGTGPGMIKKKDTDAPNRAEFVREIVKAAQGVFYSSATYAKRPDVMDLYAATDMRLAVDDMEKLGEAIAKGGVPMQQVVASMLARAGQYVRRERSFDGIAYNTPTVEVDRQKYGATAYILKAIQDFSETYVADATAKLNKEVRAEAKTIGVDNATGQIGAVSTNFTSIMHNAIDQMLLAFKSEEAANRAIEAIKRGEKPVITVASTMEAFLNEFAEDADLKAGDPANIDFSDVFRRYLERSRIVTVKSPFMKKDEKGERRRLTDKQLGDKGAQAFRDAMKLIDEAGLGDLPGSPIDFILDRIKAAGYSVAEITGRGTGLDYSGDVPRLSVRDGASRSITGRLKAINGFNNGTVDAILLNRSGSTGLSLHASEKFKDQRKRRMILVQPEGNIDTHMQMLGRVHRTGQIVLPEYDQLVGGIPAERRPAAVLAKKMASLNANTTASRDSALTSKDVLDFMNVYGDVVVARIMQEEPELHRALGNPLKGEGEDGEFGHIDAARRVTGRVPLLPIEQQEALYDQIETEYRDFLAAKEAVGENALEAKTLDLQATTESTEEAVPAKPGSTSPFADGVYIETVSAKRQGKPMPGADVISRLANNLDEHLPEGGLPQQLEALQSKTAMRQRDEISDKMREGQEYINEQSAALKSKKKGDEGFDPKLIERLNQDRAKWRDIRDNARIGAGIRMKTDGGNFYGIVTDIYRTGKSKNPLALGAWKIEVAVVDAMRQMTLPFSQIARDTGGASIPNMIMFDMHKNILGTQKPIIEAFDTMQTDSRETRSIATGNLLAAFDYLDGRGAIVNYTTDSGAIKQGIILPREFNLSKHAATRPIALASPKVIVEWLATAGGNLQGQGKTGTIALSAIANRDVFIVTAAKAKTSGGEFFLNKDLTRAIGEQFTSKSNGMVATSRMDRAEGVVDTLLKMGVKFEIPASATAEVKEQARALIQRIEPPAKQSRMVEPENAFTRPVQNRRTITLDSGKDFQDNRAARMALADKLTAQIKGMGLGDRVIISVVNALDADLRVAGEYGNNIIRVAMAAQQSPEYTVNHESIHALKALGMFKPAEWTAMSKMASGNKSLMRDVRGRYGDQGLSEEGLVEEAIADMFARWRAGRQSHSGFVRQAFQRILDLLNAIRRAVRGAGIREEVESLFMSIANGDVGGRDPDGTGGGGGAMQSRVKALDKIIGSKDAVASKADDVRTVLQDRMLPLLRTQQRIERQGGRALPEFMNAYQGEELSSGKIGARLERLSDTMLKPMFDEMQALGISQEDIESYLYARHAPERNARISSINEKFSEGEGSGMTDAEAASIMARFDLENRLPALERIAARVDAVLRFAIETRVNAGLLSQEEADAWSEQYQHYVPLRGLAEIEPENGEADRPRFGSGINIRGPESKRALGRESKASNLLAYAVMQAEEAIVRGAHNEVGQQLYRMAQANPDESFWKTTTVTRKPVFDKTTGRVIYRTDRSIQPEDAENTVSLKINGKEHRVTFNNKNAQAVKTALALRNMNTAQMNEWLGFFSKVNRWLSAANTALVPEFVITNAFRDIQTAAINLTAENRKGLITGTLKDYRKALVASTRGAFKKGKPDREWDRWYQEFLNEGGRVYYNAVDDVEGVQKRIGAYFAPKPGTTSGQAAMAAKTGIKWIFQNVENVNNGVENAVRLSAYKNARERGMSKAEAASLAKNLTVNFNRRGAWGAAINAMYLFYNASTQGSMRIFTAMKSRKVQGLMAGIVVTSMAIEMLNRMFSPDDDDGELLYDKIPAYEKERNIVIMTGDTWIKIPLPYGYNVFFAMGRAMGEIAYGKDWKNSVAGVLKTAVDAFNPIGDTDSLLNLIAPTVADPIVDLYGDNKDGLGRKIMPDQDPYGAPKPDSQLYWGTGNPAYRGITDSLNTLTGGDEVVPGAIDISPETLEYMSAMIGGGAANFWLNKTGGTMMKAATGEDVSMEDLPFARKVVGRKAAWMDKSAFYDRRREINDIKDNLKTYEDRGNFDRASAYEEENAAAISMRPALKRADKAMKKIKEQRNDLYEQRDNGTLDGSDYSARKKDIDAQENDIIQEFNADWVAAFK